MKKNYPVFIVIITMLLLLIVGIVLIINSIISNNRTVIEDKLAEQENKITDNLIKSNITIVETSNSDEKVSPNCIFVFKTLYQKCEHIKVEKERVKETMVNKTREDLEKIYKGWNIVTFRSDEVL